MYPNYDLYNKGGFIETTHIGRPKKYVHLTMKTEGVDQVAAILMQGELVVPKKHVKLVVKFLKKNNIHLPGT